MNGRPYEHQVLTKLSLSNNQSHAVITPILDYVPLLAMKLTSDSSVDVLNLVVTLFF